MRNKFFYMLGMAMMMPALLMGQPKWYKKAAKAVFTLKTFDSKGQMIASCNGFYIDADGKALAAYAPFKGAYKAIIIDASGKQNNVSLILGANEMYDVVKFKVDTKKAQPLTMAPADADDDSKVWLIGYPAGNTKTCIEGTVNKSETVAGEYKYYTISMENREGFDCCPIADSDGRLIGIMQPGGTGGKVYALSARYAESLIIKGLSVNDPALKAIDIKKDLPDDPQQAILTLFISSSSSDTLAHAGIVDDFIAKFPTLPDGYVSRAHLEVTKNRFADADADMAKAIEVAEKKEDIHYNYARMIYNHLLTSAHPYEAWTYDKAIGEADAAYAANPMMAYRQLKAQILYSNVKYQEAFDTYQTIINSREANADIWFEASQCKSALNDTTAQMALLDSCIATFSKPYLKTAAPYILARANAQIIAKKYRAAVADLTTYEALMQTEVNANFYYRRHQAELEGRMFQQALNDITKCTELEPTNTFYMAERASLLIRVSMIDDAIEQANEIVKTDANNSDGYLFLGVAQCIKGNKTEGVANLKRAKDMGDNQAQSLIDKYGK
ncbi:MAG: trypsin-like peptidase domain-containing protein [Prevotella sp.]|nr:trypsin-like peptidase domain-containing protein [Prevotella sp.]MDY4891734.1 trypsin-like peptidase domain-containing protein [Prevotella sp.]